MLTPRQRRAALALATGATFEAAAGEAGVTARTLRTWRELPDFRAAVEVETAAILDVHRQGILALLVSARERVAGAIGAGGDHAADLAVRVLSTSHLAAFAGGAPPGATRVEHEGLPAGFAPPPVEITIKGVQVFEDDPGDTGPGGALPPEETAALP